MESLLIGGDCVMVRQSDLFNRCPDLDGDLKGWALQYPELEDTFFGEEREYNKLVYTLANLKTIDKDDNKLIEYGFTESEIKTIVESYKEDSWDGLIDNITGDVKKHRLSSDKENSYINNVVRDWKEYEVPSAEQGEYKILGSGIFRVVVTYNEETRAPQYVTKDVCRTPFIICGVSEPLHDDNIYYKVRYATYSGEIKEFWESQSNLLSRKELKTRFLAKGINCPENGILMETVDYISRSIADFGTRLKKEFSAKRNGWNEDKSVFVLGDRAISATGIENILSVGGKKGYPELEKKGTLEGWINGAKDIFDYDIIRFKSYDALTAPLKSLLGVESHATDHYGNTSCGKTFSSQLTLSMIGDAENLTIGAKSTAKGILVHIRDFSDLPILIDESSDAGEHLADLVYPLTSNKGRVKSTVDGERDGGESFHTSTMFTGERPIRDCLPNSGQQYRVNELDDTLPDIPTKDINKVKQAIRENHGHIIELYLKKVLEYRADGTLQTLYDSSFEKLPVTTSNIEGRSKSIFACIMTAGWILEQVFYEIGMPAKKSVPIVKKYYEKCIIGKPVELEYIRALRVILDWSHSDFGKFTQITRETKNYQEFEYNTTLDKVSKYGYLDEDYIDVIQTEFTKKMKIEGFSPSKIKEDLFKQGITLSNDKVRPGIYRTSRKGFGSYVCVRIVRSIAESVTGYTIKDEDKNPSNDLSISQKEKIEYIFDTIKLLTKIYGEADIQLIRPFLNFPDLDELIRILSHNGKLLKTSQTTYKVV
jgi:uncharacterized protein (DUF927 family)